MKITLEFSSMGEEIRMEIAIIDNQTAKVNFASKCNGEWTKPAGGEICGDHSILMAAVTDYVHRVGHAILDAEEK
jgi:hypothetical protein